MWMGLLGKSSASIAGWPCGLSYGRLSMLEVIMKVKKCLIAVMLCGVFLLIFGGCGRQRQADPEKIQVGVACYNQSDIFLGELVSCLKQQFEELEHSGVEITVMVRDAAGSQRAQDDQVQELIDMNCNVLCVNLVDRADPSEIIDLARENDVPIIFFNREPVAEDMMQWEKLYYVGAKAQQSGEMQGELAAEAIAKDGQADRNRDGKIQYVVLEGEPGHQDAIIRTESAADTLKSKGVVLEKLGSGIANWDRAQAQNRMQQLIGQYPNQIEMVLANNDAMALGAIDAYEKLNYTEAALPVFFGIDGTQAGLEAVIDGKVAATVYNDKEGQARAIGKLAVAAVTGSGMEELEFENEKYIYLPYQKVTEENVREFLY